MAAPVVNRFSLTTHYLRMISYGTDAVIATGTGFLYEHGEFVYLVTNGHNVTGVTPDQSRRLSASAAFPVKIQTKAKQIVLEKPGQMGVTNFFTIKLYLDTDFKEPTWFVHPKFEYLVDVVAIPLERIDKIPANIKLFPINKEKFDEAFSPEVSDDVFILGYPFDITGSHELPIWKRGTIASEPLLDQNNLPRFFVDTASRPGMSGSPVIMKRDGLHGFTDDKMTGTESFGTISNFVGVYSGRIGTDDEFKAQLGLVWKPHVILEIIEAQKKGSISFQNI